MYRNIFYEILFQLTFMTQKVVFSKGELQRRIDQAQTMMRNRGVDSLFLTSDENFHYFTGGAGMTHSRSNTRPNIVIVPADGEPIAITGAALTYIVEQAGLVRDVRTYSSLIGVPNDLLVKALKDAGLAHKKVGVEMGLEQRLNMSVRNYLELTESLRDVQFVDATDIIWGLRMIKSKEELGLIRQACEIVRQARQKTFREIEIGMTEREIARLFAQHMIEKGADDVSFIHVAAGVPANMTYIFLERKLRMGNVLYLDGGAYFHTYTCDYSRIAVAGRPTLRQKRAHRAVRRASKEMAEALRPGATCADIFMIGARILKEERITETKLEGAGRMGHGQGILITEPPSISPFDKTVLTPGMVVSTEPGAEIAKGNFVWEDVHVVTEDGSEQLTSESEELYEI
jgi:Xaa-Pro dipeptidase